MADELQKSVSSIEKSDPDNELTPRVVTHRQYDEDCGYITGYELTDMDGKIYPITPNERQAILEAINNGAKVISLGKTILATHQIKHIKLFKQWFGPRAGGHD